MAHEIVSFLNNNSKIIIPLILLGIVIWIACSEDKDRCETCRWRRLRALPEIVPRLTGLPFDEIRFRSRRVERTRSETSSEKLIPTEKKVSGNRRGDKRRSCPSAT